MPFFVLKSVTSSGQTRFVSKFRNGRPRVVAFERSSDAKSAVTIVRSDAAYASEQVETCETNGAHLSTQFGGADIGVDFCVVGSDSGLGVARSVLLKRRSDKFSDMHNARCNLERDFGIEFCEEGGRL